MDEHRSPKLRTRGRLATLALTAALLGALAGCGGGSDTTIVPAASDTGGTVPTDLTISVDLGAGKTDSWTLTCDPVGGTHPNAAKACTALTAKGRTALPPVAKDVMCTQIYGGAQTAVVRGTWNGTAVSSSFKRTNGCEIGRWNALAGLLPAVSGAGPQ